MGLLDLFDEAFDLYKANFVLFTLITGLVYVPVVGIGSYFAQPFIHSLIMSGTAGFAQLFSAVQADLGWVAMITAIYALTFSLMLTALVVAASARYLDEPMTVLAAFQNAAPITIPIAALLMIYYVGMVVGYSTCVVPGLLIMLLGIPLQTFIHVMVNENMSHMIRPLRRAWNLAKTEGGFLLGGNIIHTVFWTGLLSVSVAAVDFVVSHIFSSAVPILPMLGFHKDVVDTIASELSMMLLLPFQVCVITMFYFQLRISKEGYDMEILARSLSHQP